MKIPNVLKSIQSSEILLFVLFVVYLIFPVKTPVVVAPYIESPLGMIVIILITVYLFLYSNPILAILYIFVGYELIRRSGISNDTRMNPINKRTYKGDVKVMDPETSGQVAYIQNTPSEKTRAAEMRKLNPKEPVTLEEDMVKEYAPIGSSAPIAIIESSFKPVSDNLKGASFI
jgi:hypothetical protein